MAAGAENLTGFIRYYGYFHGSSNGYLASAINTMIKSSLIMVLSCGKTLK